MKVNRNVVTWGVVIGLLLFSGIASAVWPSISAAISGSAPEVSAPSLPSFETDVEMIELKLPFLEQPLVFNEYVALLGLTAIVGGAVVGAGLPLVLLFRGLDNGVSRVKEDEAFKSGVAAMQKGQKDLVKQYSKSNPADPVPAHEENETNWTATSTALTIGFLASLLGAAFSANFLGEANMFGYAAGFGIVGLIVGFLMLNGTRVQKSDEEANVPLPGSVYFIVLTGAIVMGVGLGVMMWVRTAAGG